MSHNTEVALYLLPDPVLANATLKFAGFKVLCPSITAEDDKAVMARNITVISFTLPTIGNTNIALTPTLLHLRPFKCNVSYFLRTMR